MFFRTKFEFPVLPVCAAPSDEDESRRRGTTAKQTGFLARLHANIANLVSIEFAIEFGIFAYNLLLSHAMC